MNATNSIELNKTPVVPPTTLDLGIAVPTLNCMATLGHTLESLRPLRDKGARVVVADSFSTDGTFEYARQNADEVIQVPKGNMYAAINAGLRRLPNQWLTYINGDDILYADAIEEMLTQSNAICDVCYGEIDFIDWSGRFLHNWHSAPPADFPLLFSRTVLPMAQMGTLFRQEVFQRMNGFSEKFRYAADFDFFRRACEAGFKFHKHSGRTVAAFRLHHNQFSQRNLDIMFNEASNSVSDGNMRIPRWRSWFALQRFRLRNWDAYLVRVLRSRQLKGHLSFEKSVTLSPDSSK